MEGTVIQVEHDVPIDIAVDGEPKYFNYHLATVEVTNVLSGAIEIGDTIQVKQIEDNGTEDLDIRAEYVLFLEEYPDTPYSIISRDQGMIPVQAGRGRLSNMNQILFADGVNSLSEESSISLTELRNAVQKALGAS